MTVVLALGASMLLPVSCFDEQHPGTYYTFTGQTIADYLEDNSEDFSDFIKVLVKSRTWGELDTYGTFTCFAPTNDAFADYLNEKGVPSVDSLTKEDCDTIAWNHLIRSVYFLNDIISDCSLPSPNLLNRFLSVTFIADTLEDGSVRPVTTINRDTHVIIKDDSVQNGVIQVVDHVIRVSGEFVYDLVKENDNLSIFREALRLVGMEDSLKHWHYPAPVGSDTTIVRNGGGSDYTIEYKAERNYGFTIMAEPDKVYREKGYDNIQELIDHVNQMIHESYDYEALGYGDKYDTMWTDDRNPLRRFVRYHILPFSIPSVDRLNCREDIYEAKCETSLLDIEDYYETYLPHSIIRVSRVPGEGTFINRRGLLKDKAEFGKPFVRGVRIIPVNDGSKYEGCNGYVFYLDDILEYSKTVRTDVLNRRMRIDCCTLSPDFMTTGARQNNTEPDNYKGVGFIEPANFHSFNTDYAMWVRSAFIANISYQGDGLDLQGNYDIMLKLPPVPYDGTWELRLSYRGSEGCGVVQNYVGSDPENLQPCGIPTDLRQSAEANPNIRWKSDESFGDDAAAQEQIDAYDKAMRNRGYMKGPDSHYTGNKDTKFRHYNLMARRIITTDFFKSDMDYYLRMKLVLDNDKAEMNFDYMEWCPKSVFDNNEDKH